MKDKQAEALEAFQRIADNLAWQSNKDINRDYHAVVAALQPPPDIHPNWAEFEVWLENNAGGKDDGRK